MIFYHGSKFINDAMFFLLHEMICVGEGGAIIYQMFVAVIVYASVISGVHSP